MKKSILGVVALLIFFGLAQNASAACVITVSGNQYDVTNLKNTHSGGDVFVCGTDMTSVYNGKHGTSLSRIAPYLITKATTPATKPAVKPVVPAKKPTAKAINKQYEIEKKALEKKQQLEKKALEKKQLAERKALAAKYKITLSSESGEKNEGVESSDDWKKQ